MYLKVPWTFSEHIVCENQETRWGDRMGKDVRTREPRYTKNRFSSVDTEKRLQIGSDDFYETEIRNGRPFTFLSLREL